MGVDLSQLKSLNKRSANAFHQQKKLIAKVMQGEDVKCEKCGQIISYEQSEKISPLHLKCSQGCTDIMLELD